MLSLAICSVRNVTKLHVALLRVAAEILILSSSLLVTACEHVNWHGVAAADRHAKC